MKSLNNNGISTCQTAKTENYVKFHPCHRPRKNYIQYDYRDADGTLFSCVRPTLQECRQLRDEWLQAKKREEQV